MSLKLPPPGHPLRDKFDVAQLAEAGLPGGRLKLPGFQEALHSGRKMIRESKGAIRSVNFLICRFDGAIVLLEVKVMSSKSLWVFGGAQ